MNFYLLLTKTLRTIILVVLFSTSFPFFARAEKVKITNLGHSSMIINGAGHKILLNPFKAVGCTQNLDEPNVDADIVLASSLLLDEGYIKYKDKYEIFLVEPGSYKINGLRIRGFHSPHDRLNGRRYGFSSLWQWNQGDLNFVHFGGAATLPSTEDQLLIGKPDVLFIAVGGGSKVFNGKEAAEVVRSMGPKLVIPVQYIKDENLKNCDLTDINPFLDALKGVEVIKSPKTISVSKDLPDNLKIYVLD